MQRLYTIGYEGSTPEKLVATLQAVGVTTLADVRELPLSRKKGFSKSALSEILADAGISYLHFKSLGDPKEGRDAAKSGNLTKFETVFLRHFAEEAGQSAFAKLLMVAKIELTCIMCFERCHVHCHRSYIADEAARLGFDVFNLVPDRPEAYLKNDFPIPRYSPRESLSAAE
jgi:uncharacterized protein (DUF488 family)